MRRCSAGFLATPRRCRSCLRPFLAAAPVRPRVPLQPPRPARPLRQSLADFLVQHSLRVPLGEGVTLIGSWPCWAHYWAHLFPLSIEARAPGRALSSTQARCGSRRGTSASAASALGLRASFSLTRSLENGNERAPLSGARDPAGGRAASRGHGCDHVSTLNRLLEDPVRAALRGRCSSSLGAGSV